MQYQFAEVGLHKYHVGDSVVWDGPDQAEGEPGHHLIGVQGDSAQSCPHCRYDDEDLEFDIVIRDDVIESVIPSRGEIDYLSQGHHYWVDLEAPWKRKAP
ncbi:hypothetical protein L6E12_05725 [Actinokineospora sp. PR83]|uniref:hypothetical protein n=1 Tax=Actinokineospora sp. PR83 TaxID=2884908 RepID=UPI001F423E65|nr:hypothetical protein [Actinokineospora sp. PR83]MCG8915290.1 hypothetical protein [Actinokineospora sp. PR83]